jgi:DNA-binding response OmpR family regulator
MAILLVEDEDKIALFIARGLREEGWEVERVADAETAQERVADRPWDAMVLDLMLPGIDGIELCRRLRRKGSALPILMLTARDSVSDKVLGLDSGADDYLTKPFAFEEFMARVRALTRKNSSSRSTIMKVADLELNQVTHRVSRAGREIELSNREYALLEFLMRNTGRIVTRAMISQQVWNVDYDTYTNVIDVFINYLRRKIDGPAEQRLIHTYRGRGYGMGSEV